MIRLAPGTPKYLLLDPREIDRNKERRKAGASIVRVVEMVPASEAEPACLHIYRGYDVRAPGSVRLAYSQNTPLFRTRIAPDLPDEDFYAAFVTNDEVLIAVERDEPLAAPVEEPAQSSTDDKAPKKKK